MLILLSFYLFFENYNQNKILFIPIFHHGGGITSVTSNIFTYRLKNWTNIFVIKALLEVYFHKSQ